MKVIKQTQYQFAPHVGRLEFPGHSLTLIVKGTYDLAHGSQAVPADEELHVTGDAFFPDDPDMQGSCRYASDFVPFKPRADLLLAGTCHAHGSEPVRACQVTFRVGDQSTTLYVCGNRYWNGRPGFETISEPEPFTQMALCYENSFGGSGFAPNPVGKGYRDRKRTSDRQPWTLPTIEDPQNLIRSTKSRPQPAGFGPMGPTWQERASLLGTYTGGWVEERWPWFPEDFDDGHFNAAPRPMQVDGYLRGDEALFFENLHPDHPRYKSRLPGVRVRCFLDKLTNEKKAAGRFREVPMNLDTLWVDMDAEKLVLLWRGWTPVQSEDYPEMRHVFVMAEPVKATPASLMQCHEGFLASMAEAEKIPEDAAAPQETEPPPADPAAPSGETVDPAAEKQALRAQANAQLDALLAKIGFDMASLPPEAREKAQQERERLLDAATESDPDRAMDRQRAELQAQMSQSLSEVGIDINDLPPVSPAAKQEQVRLLQELGVEDVDSVFGNPDLASFFAIMAAVLPKAGIDPENLTPLIDEAKKHKAKMDQAAGAEDDAAEANESEKRRGPWTRKLVEAAAAQGEDFTEEDLGGLDLSGLDLAGLDFSRANLSETNLGGAVLGGAILGEADLTNSVLSEADLSLGNLAGADLAEAHLGKANLESADLTGAHLPAADLRAATLTDALFIEVSMPGADLGDVSAAGAYFIAADLTGARLCRGDFRTADFSRSVLSGADLSAANLDNATIEGAGCVESRFDGADLTGLRASARTDFSRCSFIDVRGPESIWADANLVGADFSFAQMERASFMGARLQGANLYAADMKHARFIKADLAEARLVRMNLFEGSLEKANLSDTDLSGSNLYAVEFMDAVLANTNLTGSNLRMTKLQHLEETT